MERHDETLARYSYGIGEFVSRATFHFVMPTVLVLVDGIVFGLMAAAIAFTSGTFQLIVAAIFAIPLLVSVLVMLRLMLTVWNLGSFRYLAIPSVRRNIDDFFGRVELGQEEYGDDGNLLIPDFASVRMRAGIPLILTDDYRELLCAVDSHARVLILQRNAR